MKNRFSIVAILLASIIFSCSKDQGTTITTTPSPQPSVITPQNVRDYMVDHNATPATTALFYQLVNQSSAKNLVGQHEAFNSFYANQTGLSDLKKTTGKDPAVLGLDFMFITDKNNTGQADNWYYQQELKSIADAKEAFQKGMLVTYSWHLREPYLEEQFYTNTMTDQQKATAFKSLLPNGIHHNWFKAKLDKLASVFQTLEVNGTPIPVVFRPFHEMDGSWFWWGQNYATAEEYKTVFRFIVTYLRDVKNIHNVLYAFAPDASYTQANDYLTRYPGDDYVDLLGMDNYADFAVQQGQQGAVRANEKLIMLSNLAQQKNKIAALTETGYQVSATSSPISNWFSTYLYYALNESSPKIAYVMFWNNTQNAYYIPTPASGNTADFLQFTTKARCILQPQLPQLYTLPN
ncbi:glycoside hydrolase family 26 protein [Flavobacterium sp. N1719]|uniref:glycoside hydrolase family 26 protein n=1 Tax=Flavobacterium sp. N1719 TaxID=2885633 RepID=UPI002222E454|nr:glycoside hydrolase family 26 protein [Flavobacterium sp. N1719]